MDDDQSHYEISMTAGQAFVAFVLLLLSLAASFAFGLLLGRNQTDDRLVVRKEPSVISEGSVIGRKNPGKIVELGPTDTAAATDTSVTSSAAPATATLPASTIEPAPPAVPAPQPVKTESAAPSTPPVPAYAQLLSTTEQKTAETMAAKLIEGGFSSAYVERTTSDKGPIFRVRVKFPSEESARAAETKLKTFSKDVWITKQ